MLSSDFARTPALSCLIRAMCARREAQEFMFNNSCSRAHRRVQSGKGHLASSLLTAKPCFSSIAAVRRASPPSLAASWKDKFALQIKRAAHPHHFPSDAPQSDCDLAFANATGLGSAESGQCTNTHF
jgi:hypothetical protein